jgi:hypothetical protein
LIGTLYLSLSYEWIGMPITYDDKDFTSVYFIDSMVVLECKPINELPWSELDSVGPVLILVVPQVNAEVDKRKRDGRLQKRARSFNRLISTAVDSGKPTLISSSVIDVYIGVALCEKINWTEFDDLDPQEGDHKVVAQVLKEKYISRCDKTFLSHDSNPLFLARKYGLTCKRLPESWLLPSEPHPKEKEITSLKQRLSELEAKEPSLDLHLSFMPRQNITVLKIEPLTIGEKRAIINHLLRKNPEMNQNLGFSAIASNFDHDYSKRYREYATVSVPEYADQLHLSLEKLFSQIKFDLRLSNIGHISAQDLFVSVNAKGGEFNKDFDFSGIIDPAAPVPKSSLLEKLDLRNAFTQDIRKTPERYEVTFVNEPEACTAMQIQCLNFRQGQEWLFSGALKIDPRAEKSLEIFAEITASNLHGKKILNYNLDFKIKSCSIFEAISQLPPDQVSDFPIFQLILSSNSGK